MPSDSNIIQNPDRLKALHDLSLLDSPPNKVFDRFTDLITYLLDVPTALIALLDRQRQFLLSCVGIDDPYATTRELPLSHSFCKHTIATKKPLIIENAREHPLVQDNPAIDELNVVAYLGVPLVTSNGYAIGTLCAVDTDPRQWTESDVKTIQKVSKILMHELERWHITQELQTETSSSLLQKIFNTIPTPIVLYDLKKQVVVYSNRKLEQLYGYPDLDDQVITVDFFQQYLHPNDLERLSKYFLPATETQGIDYLIDEFQMDEYRVRHYDGSWVWVQVYSIVSLFDQVGSPVESLSIIIDVTAQKFDLEQEQQQALEQEHMRLLRDLVVNFSHDLRTPLASIQLSVDLLQRQIESERIHNRIDSIKAQMVILNKILDDLSAFREMYDMDHITLSSENINDLVTKSVQGVVTVLAPKYQRIVVHNLTEELPKLTVDRHKLRMAITGLVENAFFFSDQDDTITVHTRQNAESIEVAVQDTGIGIAEEHLPFVFDPFYKVNQARTTHISKSGMGLTLVKRIIDVHGGQVHLDSTVGQGTTVTIQLPFTLASNSPEKH